LIWFVECFSKTLTAAELACAGVLRKTSFWQHHSLARLNERQKGMLNRYLDGFRGKLTAAKWATIAKCSLPTAQRDIKDLVDSGILVRNEAAARTRATASRLLRTPPAKPLGPVSRHRCHGGS